MDERRRFVRLDTRLEVAYSVLPSGQPKTVTTKNISTGGICLVLDEALSVGARLQIEMRLPNLQQPVRFTAEVAWSESYEVIGQAEHRRAVEVGVRFIDITPADQRAIAQYVILTIQPSR